MKLWSAVPRERLRVRSWSGAEGVVYDQASGDTHLLEPLAFELLRLLAAAAPRSVQTLLDELRDVIEPIEPVKARAAVEASLEAMRKIGLVVAHPV